MISSVDPNPIDAEEPGASGIKGNASKAAGKKKKE